MRIWLSNEQMAIGIILIAVCVALIVARVIQVVFFP